MLTAIRLSALMIGKLGMSVQDSINEYKTISEKIFKGGRHILGKASKGILFPRYSGKRFSETVEKLFQDRGADSHRQMLAAQTTSNGQVATGFTHW